MNRRFQQILAVILAGILMAFVPGTVSAGELPGFFTDKGKQEENGPEQKPGTTSGSGQLTAEDIEKMNNGNVTMLFSDDGYLTFLRGKYYDKKVTNEEEGIKSLERIQGLLGITKGSEFFAVYGSRSVTGYTYYVYKQRYGDLTLQNAVLKIIVDPEGYTAGLACSFTPNVGIAPENETAITKEEAIEVVKETYPFIDFTYYPEDMAQTSYTINGVAFHCWAVFTNIPSEIDVFGERHYLEHLVSYDGFYLDYTAVVSTKELLAGDDVGTDSALLWFEGKEAETYTGTVTLHDGTKKEITVPVAKDPESGLYYLADTNRHILVSECYPFVTEMELNPMVSENNTDWSEHYLITYANYIKVYDFFDERGLHSADGFGAPILILYDYCDEYGVPVDNACFKGYFFGWAVFAASELNDYGECLDVLGHEFTHAVTYYLRGGDLYENESGALNEATSDIFGNLCEMILGETDDEEWLIAENTGEAIRSMSFPWIHKQPVSIGGDFYYPTDGKATMFNDWGGVHINSSLVNYVAWQLCDRGMSMEDAFGLWFEAVKLLTPMSGFREIHHALIFAAEIRELDVLWMGMIDMLCEQAGY